MDTRRKVACVWIAVAAIVAVIALPLWRPLGTALRCYAQYASGEREQGEVLHKLEGMTTLVLHIVEGPHAGTSCTADTSAAVYDATEPGAKLELVYADWKQECELASTIEASAHFLWTVCAGLGLLLLGLLWGGIAVTRSFTRVAHPARRLEADPRDVRCPACGKAMDEGYVPLLAGLHWRQPGDPIGLPHALKGMPGTVGWRGRPRLHGFRCVPCEVLTLQYGDPRAHADASSRS